MTQDAVVTKLVSRHVAEVEVERGQEIDGLRQQLRELRELRVPERAEGHGG